MSHILHTLTTDVGTLGEVAGAAVDAGGPGLAGVFGGELVGWDIHSNAGFFRVLDSVGLGLMPAQFLLFNFNLVKALKDLSDAETNLDIASAKLVLHEGKAQEAEKLLKEYAKKHPDEKKEIESFLEKKSFLDREIELLEKEKTILPYLKAQYAKHIHQEEQARAKLKKVIETLAAEYGLLLPSMFSKETLLTAEKVFEEFRAVKVQFELAKAVLAEHDVTVTPGQKYTRAEQKKLMAELNETEKEFLTCAKKFIDQTKLLKEYDEKQKADPKHPQLKTLIDSLKSKSTTTDIATLREDIETVKKILPTLVKISSEDSLNSSIEKFERTTLQLEARADEFELAAAQVHIAAFQEVLETRESAADQTLKLIKLYNGENEPLSEETLESLKKGKKSAEAARNGALRGVLMTGLVLGTFAASLAFPIAYVATITAIFTVTSVVGLGFLSYDVHQQRKKIEALEAEIAAISAKDPTGESSTIQTQLSEKQQELKQAQTVLKGQLKSLALNSLCVGLLIAGAVCAVLAPPVGAALLTAGFATFLCMIGVPAAQSIKARFNKPAPRDATTLFPQAEVKSGSPEVKKDLSRNPDAESKSNTP